jgi:hypothetical protein
MQRDRLTRDARSYLGVVRPLIAGLPAKTFEVASWQGSVSRNRGVPSKCFNETEPESVHDGWRSGRRHSVGDRLCCDHSCHRRLASFK